MQVREGSSVLDTQEKPSRCVCLARDLDMQIWSLGETAGLKRGLEVIQVKIMGLEDDI